MIAGVWAGCGRRELRYASVAGCFSGTKLLITQALGDILHSVTGSCFLLGELWSLTPSRLAWHSWEKGMSSVLKDRATGWTRIPKASICITQHQHLLLACLEYTQPWNHWESNMYGGKSISSYYCTIAIYIYIYKIKPWIESLRIYTHIYTRIRVYTLKLSIYGLIWQEMIFSLVTQLFPYNRCLILPHGPL